MSLSFHNVSPVSVQLRNVSVSTPNGAQELHRPILSHVDADFPPGTLTGIMGSSGAGKTTLLNTLSHRTSSSLLVSGELSYNGSPALHSISNAYVTQTDVLLPALTVRETLRYAADLRLPSTVPRVERRKLVEEIILELGLQDCADTLVGDGIKRRGCSGGERRRVSLGVQMLGNPSLLFLDEPTTGLDAASAFQLVKTLKYLASKGRTIIVTIHQPRSDIYFLLDRIILLAQGQPVYSGVMSEALRWFDRLLPGCLIPHVNPADYLIDVTAIDTRSNKDESVTRARVDKLLSAWRAKAKITFPAIYILSSSASSTRTLVTSKRSPHAAPRHRVILTLLKRSTLINVRDPLGLSTAWIEAILMGLVVGLIFHNLPPTLSGIRSRQAGLYVSVGLQGYLMLAYEVYRLCAIEMPTFDRESSEGVVTISSFLIAYRISHLILEDILVPLIFSSITYYLMGLSASRFGVYLAVLTLNHFASVCFAAVAVGITRDFASASLIANLAYTTHNFSCGFFVQGDSIPFYLRWFKWTAHTFYGFTSLIENEFKGRSFPCPFERGNLGCEPYDGKFVIRTLGIPHVNGAWRTLPIFAMAASVVVYLVITVLLFKYKPVVTKWLSRDVKRTLKKVEEEEALIEGKEEDEGEKRWGQEPSGYLPLPMSPIIPSSPALDFKEYEDEEQGARIDVHLADYSLFVHKNPTFFLSATSSTHRETEAKTILDDISTTFHAGKLNLIIGPSGAGKSSLLNIMASRINSSVFETYIRSGEMSFYSSSSEGHESGLWVPDEKEIRELVGYVVQDDAALLPYLTVRETLGFTARLRLRSRKPTRGGKGWKEKVEHVIRSMGLGPCADRLVSQLSGGEKRRVSIAVQVLTEPRIILLDEPTSGLDAFTAQSIIDLLSKLAHQGRTIITTIHQARAEVFKTHLESSTSQVETNILVLAKGGRVVYSGPSAKMLDTFEARGEVCGVYENPGDWCLDLVCGDEDNVQRLVDLQYSEIKSKRTVNDTDVSEPEYEDDLVNRMGDLGGKTESPIWIALPILLHRGWLAMKRSRSIVEARIGNVFGLAVITMLFFMTLKDDYVSAQNRVGCIQQITTLYFTGILQNVATYPLERDVFYKDYADGAYSIESFFLSYTLLELPLEAISALLFAAFVAIATNLQRTVPFFFITALNALCIINAGESLGIIFNTLLEYNTGLALNLTSVVLSIGVSMAGLMSIDMPVIFNLLNYFSPLRYVVRNLMVYTFKGVKFKCELGGIDGRCAVRYGEQVLGIFGMYGASARTNLKILVAVAVVYRFMAYWMLRVVKARYRIRRRQWD